MSKIFSTLALAALVGAPAYAAQYADFDIINRTINPNVSDRLYGTFNLVTSGAEGESQNMAGYGGDTGGNGIFGDLGGFEKGSTIESASIAFWFSDPDGGTIKDGYAIKIDVASLDSMATLAVDLDNNTVQEYRAVLVETFDFGAEVLLAISRTGQLEWKIQATGYGSFNVDAAMLSVNATAPVPDGGSTAILLGIGMLGVVGAQRRFRK